MDAWSTTYFAIRQANYFLAHMDECDFSDYKFNKDYDAQMLLFIQLFKGQIMYAGSELPEILADSAKRLKGNVGKWVNGLAEMSEKNRDRPFAELWTDSLAMLRRDSALSLEVLADVDRLGKIMGDMDVEAQLSRINLVEDIITDRYQRERARSSGIKRLANSLGLLGGDKAGQISDIFDGQGNRLCWYD